MFNYMLWQLVVSSELIWSFGSNKRHVVQSGRAQAFAEDSCSREGSEDAISCPDDVMCPWCKVQSAGSMAESVRCSVVIRKEKNQEQLTKEKLHRESKQSATGIHKPPRPNKLSQGGRRVSPEGEQDVEDKQ